MKKPVTLLTIACLSLMLSAGCKSAGTSFDEPISEAKKGDKTSTFAPVSCKDTLADVPGSRGKLPANFPEPPAATKLCGSDETGGIAYYINASLDGKQILEHYQKALRAARFCADVSPIEANEVESWVDFMGCRGDRPGINGIGTVTISPQKGIFEIRHNYGTFEK